MYSHRKENVMEFGHPTLVILSWAFPRDGYDTLSWGNKNSTTRGDPVIPFCVST